MPLASHHTLASIYTILIYLDFGGGGEEEKKKKLTQKKNVYHNRISRDLFLILAFKNQNLLPLSVV